MSLCVVAVGHVRLTQVRLQPPSLTLHRPLSTGLAGVEVGEALGVGLVACGDLLLFPRLFVPVPGQHAGVLLAGVAGEFVAVWQLAGQLQAGGVGVRRE